MRTENVICDGCGKPIEGKPGFPRNDYLVLAVRQAPTPTSDFEFAVLQIPMLDGEKHFHNLLCLDAWRSKGEPA
jgi:hypothetical protein